MFSFSTEDFYFEVTVELKGLSQFLLAFDGKDLMNRFKHFCCSQIRLLWTLQMDLVFFCSFSLLEPLHHRGLHHLSAG